MIINMRIVIAGLFFLLGVSCSSPKQQDVGGDQSENLLEIPQLVEDKILDLSSKISAIQFIPLETKTDVILEGINEIKVGENRIYILDKEQESIFIFDKSGNYINKISKVGRGPEEYYYIVDFGVYEDIDAIEIYDHKKLIRYDTNGNFLSSKRVPFFAGSFVRVENGYVFFSDNFCNSQFCDNLIFCDKELNVISTTLPIQDKFRDISFSEGRRLVKVEEGVKLISYDDCIYTLSSSSIINKEKPVFEGSTTRDEFQEFEFKSLNDFVIKLMSNPNAGFINYYNETSVYTYFRMYRERAPYNYIYNKLNGYAVSYEIESKFLYREVMDIDHDVFYTYTPAVILVDRMKSLSEFGEFDRNLLNANKERLLGLQETDNPVIITYKVD